MQTTKKIEVRGLCNRYGKIFPVVKNATFDVHDGEFLSILGKSGCGKTTLLRLLIGILPACSGRILKDGVDITNTPPSNRGMGIVFQNYALFESMSVYKNVAYALKLKKCEDADVRTEEILKKVGMWELRDKKPASLSGGEQQRVAIARTMVLRPDVILFDEPLSALDASTRIVMRDEIKSLQREFGVTVVYVTHDQEEAFTMSDRIMVMNEGEIVQIGTPEEITEHPVNDYVKSFVVDNLNAKIDALLRFGRRNS